MKKGSIRAIVLGVSFVVSTALFLALFVQSAKAAVNNQFSEYFTASTASSSANPWVINNINGSLRWQNAGEVPGFHTINASQGYAYIPWNVGTSTFDFKFDVHINTGYYQVLANPADGVYVGLSTNAPSALTANSVSAIVGVMNAGPGAILYQGNSSAPFQTQVGQLASTTLVKSGNQFPESIAWPNVDLGDLTYVSGTQMTVEIQRNAANVITFNFFRPDYQNGTVPWWTGSGQLTGANAGTAFQYIVLKVDTAGTTNPAVAYTIKETVSNIRGYAGATASPVVTSVLPVAPATIFSSGTVVDVLGSGFEPGAQSVIGVSNIGMAPVYASTTYISANELNVVLPAASNGNYEFKILNPDGSDGDLTGGITYYGAPTVTEIDPWEGNPAGGDQVTLVGQGFTSSTTVTFNGQPATNLTLIDPFHLQVTTPAGNAGKATIVVKTGGTTFNNLAVFGYAPHPYMVYQGTTGLAALRANFTNPNYMAYANAITKLANIVPLSSGDPFNDIYNANLTNSIYAPTSTEGLLPDTYLYDYLFTGDQTAKTNLWNGLNALMATGAVNQGDWKGNFGFQISGAAQVAQAYDTLFPELTPAQKTAMLKYLQNANNVFEQWMIDTYGDGFNSFGMGGVGYTNRWAMANSAGGQIALSLMNSIGSSTVINTVASNELKFASTTNNLNMLTPDGGDVESGLYWGFGSSYYLQLAHFLQNATGNDHGLFEAQGLAQNYNFPQVLLGPSGHFTPFNDAQPENDGFATMSDEANRYNNPTLQYIADWEAGQFNASSGYVNDQFRGDTIPFAFIWRSNTSTPAFPGFPTSQILGTVNQGDLRSDSSFAPNLYVAVKGGDNSFPFPPSHNEHEVGEFTLESHGEDFLIDPGYNIPQNTSHTIMTIDAASTANNSSGTPSTFGSVLGNLYDQNNVRSMTVDSSNGYNGGASKVRRTVTMYADKAVVVLDDLAPNSGKPGNVNSYFQTGNITTISTSTNSFTITGVNSNVQGKFFGPAASLSLVGPNPFGYSWIYAYNGTKWYTVKANYTIATSTPLITVFTPTGTGVNGATATAVNYAPGQITVQLSDGTTLNYTSATGTWVFAGATATPIVNAFNATTTAGTPTLTWNVSNASSVAITPGSFSTTTLIGSLAVNPTSTTIYTITATNVSGNAVATTTVQPASSTLNILGIASTSTAATSTMVTWTTSLPADSEIYYGTSTAYSATTTLQDVSPALVTRHSVTIANLTPSTLYHFEVQSSNETGQMVTSTDQTVTTLASGIGTNPLSITSGPSSTVATSTATILWTTSGASDAQVLYGTSTAYGASSSIEDVGTNMTSTHMVVISGLLPATIYHYQIVSSNEAGVTVNSSDTMFVTTAPGAPTLSGANITIATTTITVNWNTSTLTDAQILYGTTTAYGSSTPVQDAGTNMATTHNVTVNSLVPGVQYDLKVQSNDGYGNTLTWLATMPTAQ